jgi:hypothetical protein
MFFDIYGLMALVLAANPVVCRYVRRSVAKNTRAQGHPSAHEEIELQSFLCNWRTVDLSSFPPLFFFLLYFLILFFFIFVFVFLSVHFIFLPNFCTKFYSCL